MNRGLELVTKRRLPDIVHTREVETQHKEHEQGYEYCDDTEKICEIWREHIYLCIAHDLIM